MTNQEDMNMIIESIKLERIIYGTTVSSVLKEIEKYDLDDCSNCEYINPEEYDCCSCEERENELRILKREIKELKLEIYNLKYND